MSAPHDVHPHDLALLYDLVDGRLAPRACEELSRRLAEEPALRAVHEGILALRHRLAVLPTAALPSDFLERVRAKAGFPAAQPTAGPASASSTPVERASPIERASPVSPAASPLRSVPDEPSPGEPAIRLVSFARYAYAAAALIVAAIGVFVYRADRDDAVHGGASAPTETADGAGYAVRRGRELTDKSLADVTDAKKSTDRAPTEATGSARAAASGEEGTSVPQRPFGPGGAIDPGLRPAGGRGAVATGSRTRDPADAASGAPASSDEPASANDGARGSHGSLESGGEGGRGDGLARKGAAPGAKPGTPGSFGGRPAAGTPGPARVPAGAFDGADQVLVVYADSLDAARAEIALLVADARANRSPDVSRVGLRDASTAAAGDGAGPKVRANENEKLKTDAAGEPTAATKASAPATLGGTPLGTFFVELDDAALARLSGTLGVGVADELRRAKDEASQAPAEADATAAMDDSEASPPPAPPRAPAPAAAPPVVLPVAPPVAPAGASAPVPAATPTPRDDAKPDAGLTGGSTTGSPEPSVPHGRGGSDAPAKSPDGEADGDARGGEVRHVRIVVLPRR